MADFVFNIAKGRIVEYYNRVKANDPANSALILVPMSQSGTEAQGQDLDDMAAVEADANFAELTNAIGPGWHRGTLTDAELAALPAPNDTDNRNQIAVPSYTWTTPTSGTATGLVICYDNDTTAGTDANLIPLTHHTFSVVADGNNVVLNAGTFLWAT